MFDQQRNVAATAEPEQSAAAAGLRYVSDATPGIRRRKSGHGFRYVLPDGSRLVDPSVLKRVRALAVPPAWKDVWLCPRANGHLQATGRDSKGRKQYRYHPRFREVRDTSKYEHVVAFADALPFIRATVREHMALPGLPREKVVATVVYLLDKTLIRVGNDDCAKQNKSYGLTTLKNRHAEVEGSEVRFHFIGKSGKQWSAQIKDLRVAKILRACQDLPGQELLQYRAEDGSSQHVSSSEVNAYLREVTGKDVTAKDFRTWAGTVLAAIALREAGNLDGAAKSKKRLRAAIERVAAQLGNTPAVCRKCYIHPEVLNSHLQGTLERDLATYSENPMPEKLAEMAPEETAVLTLLRARLKATAKEANGSERLRELLAAPPTRQKRSLRSAVKTARHQSNELHAAS